MNFLYRTALAALLLFATCIASAQGTSDYLKLRRHYNITQASGLEALETMVGSRVLEVQGEVKGAFKARGSYTVLLQPPDGDPINIETNNLPEWLGGGGVHARLLIRATREEENGELKADLLAVAPEQDIAAYERLHAPRLASRKSSSRKASKPKEWNLPANQVEPIYADFIRKQNPRLPASEARTIAKGIIAFSVKYGVDARLIMAMIMTESGFDPTSTSRTGAQGLGQLMPGTARWMGVNDAYDSLDNLYGTVKLIRTHLDQYRAQTGDSFQSLVLALAAYNAGEGAVKRHGGVPPFKETQAYVRHVVKLYAKLSGTG